jgi:DNA-binding transcriptional MerR regulator
MSDLARRAAAAPLIWNRPRLRFADDAPAGAAPSGAPAAPAQPAAPAAPSATDGSEHLGDPGKQALDRMKSAKAEAEKGLKAFTDLGLTPEKARELLTANQSATEQAERTKQEREQAEQVQTRLTERLRSVEIRAAAATMGFHDPTDAISNLTEDELAAITVNDKDEVDSAAVKTALERVAKDKAYLLKNSGGSHRAVGIGSVSQTVTSGDEVSPGRGRLRAAYGKNQQ